MPSPAQKDRDFVRGLSSNEMVLKSFCAGAKSSRRQLRLVDDGPQRFDGGPWITGEVCATNLPPMDCVSGGRAPKGRSPLCSAGAVVAEGEPQAASENHVRRLHEDYLQSRQIISLPLSICSSSWSNDCRAAGSADSCLSLDWFAVRGLTGSVGARSLSMPTVMPS
jgi:hypothetical protein